MAYIPWGSLGLAYNIFPIQLLDQNVFYIMGWIYSIVTQINVKHTKNYLWWIYKAWYKHIKCIPYYHLKKKSLCGYYACLYTFIR